MPKNKKQDSTSDSDSGPDDRVPAKISKSAKSDEPKPAKEATNEWTLEKLRKVKINEFRGRQMIDIREYYEKNGEYLPGKKGISLSVLQWKKLLEHADEINAALNE